MAKIKLKEKKRSPDLKLEPINKTDTENIDYLKRSS